MALSSKLSDFVKQVRAAQTVNLPAVARSLNMDWFREVRPELARNPQFLGAMQEVMEEIKYELMQKVLDVGLNGKRRTGKDPEISYVRAIIQFIDSGAPLGQIVDMAGPENNVDMERHLKRLNLDEETK